jgi:hypothetical protein
MKTTTDVQYTPEEQPLSDTQQATLVEAPLVGKRLMLAPVKITVVQYCSKRR